MRRALGLVFRLAALAASGIADEPVPAEIALEALLDDRESDEVKELNVGDVATVLDLVSLAAQQREHIDRASRLSWVAPGLGHSISGDRGTAFAFAAVDFVIGATSVVLASVLLPAAVRSRNLNYLQSSFSVIEERWKSIAPGQLIPSATVAASGVLLGITVRNYAAKSARRAALQSLHTGVVTFEPEPLGGIDR